MTTVRNVLLATTFFILPTVSMAAAVGAGDGAGVGGSVYGTVSGVGAPGSLPAPNAATMNAAPGGITLVPGTVVTPGVSGSNVTGTVPLAGTIGSPGVGNLNPNVTSPSTSPGIAGNPSALYPSLQSQSGLPNGNQGTMPGLNGLPSVSTCPAGVTHADGTC